MGWNFVGPSSSPFSARFSHLMRGPWMQGVMGLGVLLFATGALADPGPAGGVAVYRGTSQLLPVGDLVQCDGPVLQTRLTYLAMPGVCDDLGQRSCGGRLVAQLERCVQGNVLLAAGDLIGGYSRNAVRFCSEEDVPVPGTAVSCSDYNRVAEGSWTGAGHGAAAGPDLTATAILTLERQRAFRLDGQRLRLPRQPQIQHFSQQRSVPGPASCAVAPQSGCGVIGTGVSQ